MAFLLLLLFILEVHSLNISHVIEVYTNICGSKLCGRSTHATQSDIIKRFNISECPPCYCDKQCFSQGNCCPDFYFSYPLKCTNINIVEKSPYKNSTSVLMVDTCPSFADNKTMYLCEKKNDELIDKIQNSPVTSTRNNLIYRNIYCALCHNETKENLINWKLEIQCTDFADFNFLSSYEEILNTVNAKRCNIGFHTDIPTRDLPICNSVDEIRVQKCNITGTWEKYDSDIQKACETYNQKSYPFFKNIFCFICNPPRNQDNIISQCNITGLWRHNDVNDSNLEQACKMGMSSTIVLPFRNIYCYICNNGIVNHVNNDLVNFAMRNKCQLSSRPPKPVNPARRKGVEIMFNKSNVTRRWHRIDPDIKYVCENMNTSTFSTIFCLIWHPNRHNETLISSCNMTLKSSMYDFNTIEHLCLTLPAIANVAPYKNELCRQYNEYSYLFSSSHIITTHRPPPNGLPSFRVLFTLQLTSYENKLDSSNESSCDDVFIQETGECRNLKCYPGRILINDACIPLLPTSTNLGYILAVCMNSLLTETINSTRLFLQSIDTFFQMHLYRKLEIKMYSCTESSLLLTDLSCGTGTTWENGTEIILFGQLTFFIPEYVNRSSVEIILLQNLNSQFNVTHEGATYTFHTYPVSEAFNTHSLIRKSGFTNKCFRKQTYAKRYREVSPDLFVHSQVTDLLTCNQVELKSSEFEIDRLSMNLTFLKNELQLTQDQFILTPFKTARVCLDTFERLMSIQSAQKEQIDYWGIILRICTLISLTCLFVTFQTYCLFPTLRTVPGKNNMCLIFAMFWAHTILQFGVFETELEILCKIIGIVIHYFWLVTFGCLNICSYHMYKVFTNKTIISSNEKLNIKLYIVYSYGIPAIIVGLNIVINTIIANDRSVGYGELMCFISQPISTIVTFVIPVSLVCVANILFFVFTSVKIATRPKFRTEHSTKIDRVYFTVYLKLFSITGISWVLQIIDSFLMTSAFSNIVSVLNALQGVFIFISFTCNNRVLTLYKTMCGKTSPHPGNSGSHSTRLPICLTNTTND